MADAKLSRGQLWALAAGANLTSPRGETLTALALGRDLEAVRHTFARDWGMLGPADVARLVDWLRGEGHSQELEDILRELDTVPETHFERFVAALSPSSLQGRVRFAHEHRSEFKHGKLVAWDMVRMSLLARAGFTLGWLDEAAAWDIVMEAARKLQSEYVSWAELSANYTVGRGFWGEGAKSQPIFDKHATWLLTSSKSPWQQLDWNLPLPPPRRQAAGPASQAKAPAPSLTAEQARQVRRAFMRRCWMELLVLFPMIGGALCLKLLNDTPGYQIAGVGGASLGIVACAAMAAGVVLHLWNWRCPVCRSRLRGGVGRAFCARCRIAFNSLPR